MTVLYATKCNLRDHMVEGISTFGATFVLDSNPYGDFYTASSKHIKTIEKSTDKKDSNGEFDAQKLREVFITREEQEEMQVRTGGLKSVEY